MLIDGAAVVERDREIGVELDRLVEIGERMRSVSPLRCKEHGAAVEHAGIGRVELDRLLEILQRAVDVPRAA